MKCSILSQGERLFAYCTGKLRGADAAALEQHLKICPTCREWVTDQRGVFEALDAWEAAPVSAEFNRALYARIDQQPSWRDRLFRLLRPPLSLRGLPLAAAACLVMAIGVALQWPHIKPQPPVPVEVTHPEQVVHALDIMEMLGSFDQAARTEAARSEL
jgi:anti-sigma factor RsiW